MPPLFPPDYPHRPDAPLLSFGPSFSEEISRSVIGTIWRGIDEDPYDAEVRIAAGLTMLEAFHPRDHLECMMSAHAVGLHAAVMDSLARAMRTDLPDALVIKYRSNAVQLVRGFSQVLRDIERHQGKPLPERPTPPPLASEPQATPPDDAPDPPEDIETRPDGTPGSLAAYAPKPPEQVFIPREPAIMVALATRPKPWRLVNAPAGEQSSPIGEITPAPEPVAPASPRLFDPNDRMITGDALARFASTRLDPNAPFEPPNFDDEESVVELELVSTGGDPEAEADRQAMMAAHPEGKPIVTLRYGGKKPPERPPDSG